MRKSFLLSGLLCLALTFSVAAFAKDDAGKSSGKAKAEPANKKCPITGDDVDPAIKGTMYKGKLIGFCCKDCPKKFAALKAPEKEEKVKAVLADSADSGKSGDDTKDPKKKEGKSAKGETAGKPINTNCLVHPENAIDQTVTTTYKGKTIGFCCEDCQKKFNADPDSFAKAAK